MKSIENLREYVDKQRDEYNNHNVSFVWQLSTIADEIEAEIADNYMRLPVDADGVPIHVGDVMTLRHGKTCEVVAVSETQFTGKKVGSENCVCHANLHRHVKPDPLKELLNDHLQEREKIVRKLEGSLITLGEAESEEDACDKLFAERIRELLGGDAE